MFVRCNSNAKCINRAFSPLCVCNYGYSGNGKSLCDECGVRSVQPNLRIIGGVASVESSWPEVAYVTFSYSAKVRSDGDTVQITYSSFCGGTLVNHKHVLTAAHCIPSKVRYQRNRTSVIDVPVVANSFYPSYESMIKVYLGVHNRTFVTKIGGKSEYSVEKFIKVSHQHISFMSLFI
jgi:Trypsin